MNVNIHEDELNAGGRWRERRGGRGMKLCDMGRLPLVLRGASNDQWSSRHMYQQEMQMLSLEEVMDSNKKEKMGAGRLAHFMITIT